MARPMLEKLRSRHPIDLPVESWGRSRGLLGTLGTILVLVVLLPLLGVAYYAVMNRNVLAGVLAAVSALVLVVLAGSARGKSAHRRR